MWGVSFNIQLSLVTVIKGFCYCFLLSSVSKDKGPFKDSEYVSFHSRRIIAMTWHFCSLFVLKVSEPNVVLIRCFVESAMLDGE